MDLSLLIVELTEEGDWRAAYPVIAELRPTLSKADFLSRRDSLLREGYRLFGGFLDGRCVTIASAIVSPHPVYRRELLIHDMVTTHTDRSRGFGRRMLRHLLQFARKNECGRIFVHSRTERTDAQRFYRTHGGFEPYSVGMIGLVKKEAPEDESRD